MLPINRDRLEPMIRLCFWSLVLGALVFTPVWAQDALVSSPQPVSVGMSLQGGVLTLDLQVTAATTVSVFCPVAPGLVSFTGLTAPVEATYDQKRQVLALSLPPGQYKVTVRSLR